MALYNKSKRSWGEFVIEANSSGLISLAKTSVNFSFWQFESGEHIHYEAGIMLDNESADFVIEKI